VLALAIIVATRSRKKFANRDTIMISRRQGFIAAIELMRMSPRCLKWGQRGARSPPPVSRSSEGKARSALGSPA